MMGIISIIIGYVLGSLSGAIILSKIKKTADPRTTGSGNAGATNVLRSSGLSQAAIVMLIDIAKGLLAVIIARLFDVTAATLSLVALAAVIGHIFPVYFKFKGGKGVATMMGCLLGLSPLVGILSIIIWAATVYVSKYASLASIVTALAAVLLTFIFGNSAYSFSLLLIAILVIWKHKDNIARLRNGTEDKTSL